jgi:acyl-CoA synthetase (AMP-forming)/AMP-acid ligase II
VRELIKQLSIYFGIDLFDLVCLEEMCHQLEKTSCIITHPLFLPNLIAVQEKQKRKFPIVCLGDGGLPDGIILFKDLLSGNIDISNVPPVSQHIKADDVCYLPFSSGTSGLPKGVCLTHKNLNSNLIQVDHPDMTHVNLTTSKLKRSNIL